MRKFLIILLVSVGVGMCHAQTLSIYKSTKSVAQTTSIIEANIKKLGLVFFETVSHDAIAAARGVKIGEMREILFEDGGLTTSLIECQPTTALDLPLKILIWEENGDVYIAYMDPRFMKKRFMLSGCEEIVDKMGDLLARIVVDAMRTIQGQD